MFIRLRFAPNSLSIRYISALAKSLQNAKIEQLPEHGKFRLKLDDADYATVTYERRDHNLYTLLHTEVPHAYQGQGIGKLVAEKTFQYIINEKKRMYLVCDLLQKYYGKNRDRFKDHVDENKT